MQKSLLRVALITVLILFVPFIAMQFTDEVNWDAADFIVAAVLLFGTGLVLEFVAKKFKNSPHKILVLIVIILLFLLTWVELAVGIFGTPWAGS